MTTSLRLVGNRDLAAHYRGEAVRLLFHLKQILGSTPSGGMNRTYLDGTTICIRKFFDNEIILISSPFRGGKRVEEKLEIFVFLFFNESQYRIFKLSVESNNYLLTEEAYPKFPFDHVWYSDIADPDRNISPWVASNEGNQKHYINTGLQPDGSSLLAAGNAYDDWHYHNVQFNFSLDWLGWDGAFRESPSIRGGPWGTNHVSISPYTAYADFNIRLGGIDQVYRQFVPSYSLVPLMVGGVRGLVEVINNGPGAYGPRGYTLDADTHLATSWKERVYPSSSIDPTLTPFVGMGVWWLGWFWFPWIPYLHEIHSFPILDRLGQVMRTKPINPQIYSLQYLTDSGVVIDGSFLSDNAGYAFNDGSYLSVPFDLYSILHWVPGPGPAGGYFAGSWVGKSSESYTLTGTGNQSKSASSSGTYYFLVGSLGKKQVLNIKNVFDMSMSFLRNDSDSYSKSTSMSYLWYVLWSGIEEYWLPDGDYLDTTSGSISNSTVESRQLNITQTLNLESVLIDTGLSVLKYDYSLQKTGTGSFSFSFHQEARLPLYWLDSYWTHNPGSAVMQENILATVSRDIVCFEVLAFDSMQNTKTEDLFIVIYKKITISHSQSNALSHSVSSAPEGPLRSLTVFPWPVGWGPDTETFSVSGTRKVEYWLAYKIGDGALTKVKLTEFNSALNQVSGNLVHTGSGSRLWGVSCQLNKDVIVYHYQKDTYLNNGTSPAYDSPMNFEDINYQGVTKLWQPSKIVVGCIAVNDGMGNAPGYRKEFEYDPGITELIYSVGLHRKDKEQTEREE